MSLWRGILAAFTYHPKDVLGPVDTAERLTRQGRKGITVDTAGLGEHDIVKSWLAELGRVPDQHVLVHRQWGTVTVAADAGGVPVRVLWSDGATTWYAVPPEAIKDDDLSPEQVTSVMLDALTSSGPPEWPQWRVLM